MFVFYYSAAQIPLPIVYRVWGCGSMSIFPPYCAWCLTTDVVGQSLCTSYIQESSHMDVFLSTRLSNKIHTEQHTRSHHHAASAVCPGSLVAVVAVWLSASIASEFPVFFPIFILICLEYGVN
jgi:hypothetical protein